MEVKTEKIGEICPFSPYVATNQRSIFCVKDWCKMWDKKKKDCGLKR